MAGRFIRGIILSFLPPSASPGRNTSEEEANIDLLLVKLTATYNQEIKRNDRWPLRQSLIQLSLPLLTRGEGPPPLLRFSSFTYTSRLSLSSLRTIISEKEGIGREGRRLALRRIKMSSKNLPYHVDPFQLRAIRARKDL